MCGFAFNFNKENDVSDSGRTLGGKLRKVDVDALVELVVSAHRDGLLTPEQYEALEEVRTRTHLIVTVRGRDGVLLGHHVCKKIVGEGTTIIQKVTCPDCQKWLEG